MADLLLVTKLQIPPVRPNRVTRTRLFAQLDEGLGYPLMLVSAPPGFGKTTIVSEWAANARFTHPEDARDLRLDARHPVVNRQSKIINPPRLQDRI